MAGDGRLGNLMEIWTPWWKVEQPLVQEVEKQSETVLSGKSKILNQSGKSKQNGDTKKSKLVLPLKVKQFGGKKKVKAEPEAEIQSVCAERPSIKNDIPQISSLLKSIPSSCIKYNVVNVLYSYAYVSRLHNGEHVSMATESAEDFIEVSEVMGQGQSFETVREAIQGCLTKIQGSGARFPTTQEYNISIIKDVQNLICMSSSTNPVHSVLLALSDVYDVFKAAHKNCSKSFKFADCEQEKELLKKEKSEFFKCMKKSEFMLSWAQIYGMSLLGLVPDLEIEYSQMSGELESMNQSKKQLETQWGGKTKPKKKTLVEEL